MNTSLLQRSLLSLAILASMPALAADCADRFESTSLGYLGRNSANTKSYWLTMSNRADSFRLSAPGVIQIDAWQSAGAAVHISESDIVLNDANGTHKLDRIKADGSYDCFLQSRKQSNPILPPTWRPPAKPERPIVVRPERPDRPVAIRPELPDRPIAIRPTLPDRPIAIKPTLPERPTVIRPDLPDRPVAVKPSLPELPEVNRPNPEQPIVIAMNGNEYALTMAQLMQYCPSLQLNAAGDISDEALLGCSTLITELQRIPLTQGRDVLAPSLWNSWADVQYLRSNDKRGLSPQEGRGATISIGVDRMIEPDLAVGVMLSLSNQDSTSFAGHIASESDSVMVGPYLAYGLSPNWSLFGSAMLGQVQREYQLLTLTGKSRPMQYNVNLNLEGQYALNPTSMLRPKLGINYKYENSSSYPLQGTLLGKTLAIEIDGQHHDAGQMQASLEFNTRLKDQQGRVFIPYFEAGALYNYLEPRDANHSSWQGLARVGIRTLAAQSWQIDVSASHQSLGVSGLNIWSCALFVSHAF